MNPGRSLGPATVSHSFPGYFWIYWVGPGLGSLLACAFYEILGYLHWWEVNVGQDSDGTDIEKHQCRSQTEAATCRVRQVRCRVRSPLLLLLISYNQC
jgi:aquaporin related protein